MPTTLPGTGKIISSDPLNAATGLNGGVPATGEETQRVKVAFGSAGFSRDVDAANPLPVVNASLPLPAGAAIAANQQINALTDAQLRALAVAVSGAFFQATQPISAASLPLPAGAAADGTDGTTPPAVLGAGTGIRGWLRSIYEKLTGSIAVTGTFFQATQPVSGAITANAGTNLSTAALNLEATQAALSAKLPATLGQKAMAASLAVTLASDQTTLPAVAETRASTLWITATAAVNTAATASLPAAGAGLFHYITRVELIKLYAVVGVAAGTGVIITTTNLPGNPAFTTEQSAGVAGMAPVVINWTPATPFKSSVANTITTFAAPVQLQTIWRWNVSYFTAP